ncbi:MAG TPA: hypothetical protein VKF36_08205 [Syntrophorhabdales bacterium]|nr:hypothetical protein [Syntrophorhabdales bacterium]
MKTADQTTCAPSRGRSILLGCVVLTAYVLLSLVMTYPLVFKIGNSVGDLGDPLLNTWILAWDVKKFMDLDFLRIFEANIFFPSHAVLAYSEIMFGNALIALPVMAVSKNPILAYNIVYLSGVILSGFGAYLLALYLTKNQAGAFCSGLIFAFFPYRVDHISHVQLQVAEWIPLALLCLHKMSEKPNLKYSCLFALCFLLQFLSCGYYGIFLAVAIIAFITLKSMGGRLSLTFYRNVCLSLLAACAILMPCLRPYIRLKHELGFTRSLAWNVFLSADLLSYLSAPPSNWLYGKITRVFLKAEGGLFLGIVPMVLALSGMGRVRFSLHRVALTVRSAVWSTESPSRSVLWLKRLCTSVFLFYLVVLGGILVTGGIRFSFLGYAVRVEGTETPATLLLLSGAVICLLSNRLILLRSVFRAIREATDKGFYVFLLCVSFVLSLGPSIQVGGRVIFKGPYLLLYKYFPGFDGLRVPARMAIIVALCVSVLAAYGIAGLRGPLRRTLLPIFAALVILIEFASMPMRLTPVPLRSDIPEVYRWLNSQEGKKAIIEMPMAEIFSLDKEAKRIYFSIYHWKSLVNGYSGYVPPYYLSLIRDMNDGFPFPSSVRRLRELGVDYVILHSDEYDAEKLTRIQWDISRFRELEPVKQFGNDYVFQIKRW